MASYQSGNGKTVPLLDFAPDSDPLSAGIILDARSALPTGKGFKARNSVVQYGPALAADFNGGILAYYTDGTVSPIAGAGNNIYRLIGGVWTSVGAGYQPTSTWRMFQFGDDVIAVANGVAPQMATGAAGTFAALAGSPPTNSILGLTVGGAIPMLFETANWHSGAPGTDISWAPSIQTQAGRGQLYDFPGNITAAAPIYRNVVVAKGTAMWLGEYIGGSSIWNFQPIADAVGCLNHEAMIPLTDSVAFLGTDDFYLTGGYTPQRIPNNLKHWFFSNADPAYLANVWGWWDQANSIAWWHFVSTAQGSSAPVAGLPDMAVGWHQRSGKWTVEHINLRGFLLPAVRPTLTTGLFFDTNNVLRTWSGAEGQMMLETGYMGDPSRLSQLMRMRWGFDAYPTSQTLHAMHAPFVGSAKVTTFPDPVKGNDDWFNLRQYDRVHQAQLNTVGPCEVTSYAFEARIGGSR